MKHTRATVRRSCCSAVTLRLQSPAMLRPALREVAVVLALSRVGFATYLAYPAGVFMVFVSYPVVILMYRFVFSAVYEGGKNLAGYNLSGILTYVTVSWLLNTFYMTPTGRQLGARVRDGAVAVDLLRPYNLMGVYFGQGLGRTLFRVIFATIPLMLIFALSGGILPPQPNLVPQFLLAICCGYLINFELDYMIGLIAFFFGYNNGIRWGIRLVMSIAGGMVIPLNYLPPAIGQLFMLQPTQFMFYQPLQIYLGRESGLDAWISVAGGLSWVMGLLVAAQLMQRAGQRRLSISGG